MRSGKTLISILLILLTLSVSMSIYACSVCMTAYEDYALPPIMLWCFLSIALFIISGVIRKVLGMNIPFMPSIGQSIGYSLALLVAGFLIFGLGLPVILLPPAILYAIMLLIRPVVGQQTMPNGILMAKGYAILVIITIASTSIYSYRIQHSRSKNQFVIEWGSTAIGRAIMREMANKGPSEIENWREIAKKGRDYTASQAATFVAKYGNREQDVPLLIDTLEHLRKEKRHFQYPAEDMEKTLKEFSGLNLPEGTSVEAWRTAWRNTVSKKEQ